MSDDSFSNKKVDADQAASNTEDGDESDKEGIENKDDDNADEDTNDEESDTTATNDDQDKQEIQESVSEDGRESDKDRETSSDSVPPLDSLLAGEKEKDPETFAGPEAPWVGAEKAWLQKKDAKQKSDAIDRDFTETSSDPFTIARDSSIPPQVMGPASLPRWPRLMSSPIKR